MLAVVVVVVDAVVVVVAIAIVIDVYEIFHVFVGSKNVRCV